MRSNRILTVSLLLLPALPSLAQRPAGQAPLPRPPGVGAVSLKIDDKPQYVRDLGGKRIFGWKAALTAATGRHEVVLTQTNAARPEAPAGTTFIKALKMSVEPGGPLWLEFLTWGPRPQVKTKIERSSGVPDRTPAEDPSAEQPPTKQPPAEQPRGDAPPADAPPAAGPGAKPGAEPGAEPAPQPAPKRPGKSPGARPPPPKPAPDPRMPPPRPAPKPGDRRR